VFKDCGNGVRAIFEIIVISGTLKNPKRKFNFNLKLKHLLRNNSKNEPRKYKKLD
jgi:hypothetical protein